MRKLMWFALGFALACAFCVWVLPMRGMLPSVLAAVGLMIICKKRNYRCLVCILSGCIIGLGWYSGFAKLYLLPAHAMDGSAIETTVTATGYSYETDYGVGVDGEFDRDGKRYKIRLYVNSDAEIRPGDTITGTFKLRYTGPEGMRDPTYHAGEGILFLGYERGSAEIRRAATESVSDMGVRLNHSVGQLLTKLFPGDVEAFCRALLLGDDYDLDYATDTHLRISGIRHIVAVSGLHVAILYTILRALTLNRRWLTAIVGIPVLYLFAAVALFTPSVSRACIMVGLMMLAQIFDREYDTPTALSFAALVMLAENPLVITSISFQMSVVCVAGILMFHERIKTWMETKLGKPKEKSIPTGLKRWFISSVSISLSAMVLTTPLSALYFGTVSLVGVLTNLLTLWAVSMAFYGIVAVCLMSLVWCRGASVLAWLVALPIRYVLTVSDLLASFPLAAVYTKSSYIVVWLIFVYILLAVFLLSRKRHTLVLSCCAVIGLCGALILSWTEHTLSDVHLTALDVGQGQSLILHSEGRTYLIDCGGNNDEIAANEAAENLLSRGITHLDGIILTHGDRDHSGGIPHLLTRMDADFIMLPATTDAAKAEEITAGTSGAVIYVEDDLTISFGNVKMTVFGPIFAPDSNENSLCVLFERENCDILITGDRGYLGEMMLLNDAELPELEVFIAGHHGSKNSNSEELLSVISPEIVIISAGKDNAYGHPAEETLKRLAEFGCEVYRTDLHGTIIYRR